MSGETPQGGTRWDDPTEQAFKRAVQACVEVERERCARTLEKIALDEPNQKVFDRLIAAAEVIRRG